MATVHAGAGISPVSTVAPPPDAASQPQQPEEVLQTGIGQPVKAEVEPPSHTQTTEVSRERVLEIAESLGQVVSVVNERISIRIDESTDLLITEIVNRETNEVIKQIPPQELVELSGRLREFLGILLDIEV
jgi:flagellar protein FlaG